MMELTTSHKLFHSFCTKTDTRFDTQGKEETVYLVLRAHPITMFPYLFNGFILFALLVLLNAFFPSFLMPMQNIFVNLFFLLFIGNYIAFGFVNWYFNMGIVTDKRVVDIDFNLVLFKVVTYTRLDNIEDVTAKSGGFIPSIFNYGNLFIQTAGTEINTEFMNIPHPSGAAKIIDGLMQAAKTSKHGEHNR
jgi:hypothetical protein